MVRKALGLMEMGPPWVHTRWVTRWETKTTRIGTWCLLAVHN